MFNPFGSVLDPGGTAACDPLTGVLSRGHLVQHLRQYAAAALDFGRPFSLLMLDLDHFKSVNDAFGYARGDQVLVEFTRRLTGMLRQHDLIFRYGGDEFIILLPETDKTAAAQVAQKLLDAIETSSFSGEPAIQLSLSIGVATCPEDGLTPEQLFEAADRHHYEAKRSGRRRVVQEMPVWQSAAPFMEPPLLIEREDEIRRIDEFILRLPGHRRGLCKISGPPGAGKSRLLTEAARLARLQGFQLLNITGSPARRARLFGALQEAVRSFEDLPDPLAGEANFLRALDLVLVERDAAGLLVLIDNPEQIDPQTLEFIQSWVEGLQTPSLAYLLACPQRGEVPFLSEYDLPRLWVELEALSPAAVRQWLKASLGELQTQEINDWIYLESAGLPGSLQAALTYLYEQDLITRSGENWQIAPEAVDLPLQRWLAGRRAKPLHNLPAGLPELVGRREEINLLKQALQDHNTVLLCGPGGIGKTRLAVQIGLEMLDQFRDGVYFANLDQPQSSMVAAIADALDLRFHGAATMESQLQHFLHAKDLLLILDNPADFDELSPLLGLIGSAPSVRLLITAREKHNLAGSTQFELSGFQCTDPGETAGLYSPAERLFLHTARRFNSDFRLEEQDRSIIGRICQLLDGLPLAVELAASWTNTYSLAEIEKEIQQGLAFLTTRRREVPERHRSLLAIFDSFWSMLSPDEQLILSRLAIFQDGFSVPAAREVAEASPFFLDALAGRGYLFKHSPEYYSMHELLRRYSLEKLSADSTLYQTTREQHCRFFIQQLYTNRQAFARGTLPPAHAYNGRTNFRLAWVWALENRRLEQLNLGVEGYYSYLHLTGNFKEGELAFHRAIEHMQTLTATDAQDKAVIRTILCKLQLRLAGFLNKLGLFAEAMEAARTASRLARSQQDDYLLAASLLEWGDALRYQGQYKSARKMIANALEIARRREMPILLVDCLYALGAVAHYLADLQEQRSYSEEALQISLANEDLRGQSRAYNLLAIVTEMEGKYSQAKAYYERAIQLSQQSGDRRSESIPLINLASLLQLLGNYTAARRVYEQFLEIKQELSDRPGEVWGLVYFSLLFHQLGNQPVAERYARLALHSAVEIGDRHNQATALTILGHALTAQRAYEQAEDVYRQAVHLRQELEQDTMAMEAHAGLARAALYAGQPGKAQEQVDRILCFLESKTLDGTDEPFRVWLTCYQVLESAHDDRAGECLQRGYTLLMERADQIQDPELRRSFLENVSAHQSLVSAWGVYSSELD